MLQTNVVFGMDVRGLNSLTRKRDVKQHLLSYNINIMGLVKHKLSNENILKFSKFLSNDQEVIHNNEHDNRGRILLLRNKSIWSANNVTMSDQHIRCSMINKGGLNSRLTIICAKHSVNERAQVWRNLSGEATNFAMPWIFAGDFNCILNHDGRVTSNNLLNADLDFKEFP